MVFSVSSSTFSGFMLVFSCVIINPQHGRFMRPLGELKPSPEHSRLGPGPRGAGKQLRHRNKIKRHSPHSNDGSIPFQLQLHVFIIIFICLYFLSDTRLPAWTLAEPTAFGGYAHQQIKWNQRSQPHCQHAEPRQRKKVLSKGLRRSKAQSLSVT